MQSLKLQKQMVYIIITDIYEVNQFRSSCYTFISGGVTSLIRLFSVALTARNIVLLLKLPRNEHVIS
jgi:hypothetical protein